MTKDAALLEIRSYDPLNHTADLELKVAAMEELLSNKKCCGEQPDGSGLREAMKHAVKERQNPTRTLDALAKGMKIIRQQATDAEKHAKDPAHVRASRRVPSLAATLGVELFVALVIANYFATLNRFQLLIAVQPVISAISGNIGLQSSSINVRGLSTGFSSKVCKAICNEVKAGLWLALVSALAISTIAGVWYYIDSADPTLVGTNVDRVHSSLMFAIAVAIGQFCAGMSACVSGAAAPLLFKALHCDPANLAGPLETAFQDVVGSSVLLTFSAWFLDITNAGPQCPSLDWDVCVGSCLNNSTFAGLFDGVYHCVGACQTFCNQTSA
eukprot:INCI1140.1.p1 GENE.INCI1140.1~~INCI1140.1.p1  ORF type:complete len:358 (-),score=65.11 INCI1140.1:263-1246(-)